MRFALAAFVGVGTVIAVGSAPVVASDVRLPDAPETTASLRTGPLGHRWRGHVEIAFHNGGSEPLDEIWLRLWPNGIGGCAAPLPVRTSAVEGGHAGALTVDCTVLPVTLDAPVPADGTGRIRFRIAIDVPHRNDRFGWSNGIAFLGSALPAIALSDADGTHLDPYSDLGESFYSQVGRYSVTLDVPSGLDTPATGTLSSVSAVDGRVVRTYEAADVRDFAWAAGRLRQRSTSESGVLVRVWHPKGSGEDGRVALAAAVRGMNEYRRSFGPYGYPEVDVVSARYVTFGGMEYPTLVFANPNPSVVAHELAHQWWYGIVGNDEYREPWLDEAFASWAEYLVADREAASGCRQRPWPSASARISNGMDYWEAHPADYTPVVYEQGACALSALAARFGLKRFVDVLADYVAAHRLGFSTTASFTSSIESAAAGLPGSWDPASFWDRWRIGAP